MPSEITHWAVASRAAGSYTGTKVREVLAAYPNLYALGAVIPDTPYYKLHGIHLREIRAVADTLHGKSGEDTYDPARKFLGVRRDGRSLAFLLGFLTHLCIDAAFHPYVYYFTGSRKMPGREHRHSVARHFQFEAYLDLHYLETFHPPMGGLFKYYCRHKETAGADFARMVALLYFGTEDYPGGRIRRILRMHSHFQQYFKKVWPINMPRMYRKILGYDPGSAPIRPKHQPFRFAFFNEPQDYRHPVTGEALRGSVADIEASALAAIRGLFDRFESAWDEPDLTAALSALTGPSATTGLPHSLMSDMKYFDLSRSVKEMMFGRKSGI